MEKLLMSVAILGKDDRVRIRGCGSEFVVSAIGDRGVTESVLSSGMRVHVVFDAKGLKVVI